MGGGLMQLVAYGAQDVYLTGNPQITFFKVVYRRHTNFARENIEQVFDGNAALGSSVVCTLSRSGDLVNNIYLTGQIESAGATGPYLGHKLIKTCEVEIGGQKIDKHYGQWLQIYSELHGLFDIASASDGDVTGTKYGDYGFSDLVIGAGVNGTAQFYIPLRFWFCNNPGLALPLIALQYHEVKIKLSFESSDNLTQIDSNDKLTNAKLLVDYIYLDTDERRRFAQVSHEYLIEQVQHEGTTATVAANNTQNVTVNFNHPVKYCAWAIEDSDKEIKFNSQCPLYSAYTSANIGSAKLMLNGNDRFETRDLDYFTNVQTQQHFGVVPPDQRIGVYSFANNPKDHQPSGTCNFSRIDSAIWQFKWGSAATTSIAANDSLWMFAVNYNVLRVMSGMGGLAYSN